MYLLGYDIGSSSIKVALVEASSGETVKLMQHPKSELTIIANHADWAEQHPETWWNSVCQATKELLQETQIDPSKINGIGIAYQMHGLVCIDENQAVLRPSIIWCDSSSIYWEQSIFRNWRREMFESFSQFPWKFYRFQIEMGQRK